MTNENEVSTPEGGQQTPEQTGEVKQLSQPEIDKIVEERLARDRRSREEALAKDLGMSLKEAKAALKAKREADDAQKTEMEKLLEQVTKKDQEKLELEMRLAESESSNLKLKLAAEAGLPAKYHDYIRGITAEEIQASIAKIKADFPDVVRAAQGAGNAGIQQPTIPKGKIWTQEEVRELRLSGKLTDELMNEIRQATAEGRIQ